jgi:hypothetical protein
MSTDAINFLVGWLAGLVSSSVTLLIGYHIQVKSDDRKKRSEILNRRLDQAEEAADAILEIVNRGESWFTNDTDGEGKARLFTEQTRDTLFTAGIFMVLADEQLWAIYDDVSTLLRVQADLIEKYSETSARENFKADQRDLNTKFMILYVKIKRRVDFLRASDPRFYFRKL